MATKVKTYADMLANHDRMTSSEYRQVRRKLTVCHLSGHLWELESHPNPTTFHLVCNRCFPHIQSRKTVESYNLFPMPEKEPD